MKIIYRNHLNFIFYQKKEQINVQKCLILCYLNSLKVEDDIFMIRCNCDFDLEIKNRLV